MKFFTFILALLVFVLSTLPCSDKVEDYSVVNNHEHSHSNDLEHDQCSAFCICACCGSLIVINSTSFIKEEAIELIFEARNLYTYKSIGLQSYSNSIWHPPAFC